MISLFKIISEIKIIRGPKTWDLTKEGVRFENIKEGDFIQFYIEHPNGKKVIVKQKVIKVSLPGEQRIPRIKTQDLPKLGTQEGFDYWTKNDIENHYKEYEDLDEIKIHGKFKALPKIYMVRFIKEEDTEIFSKSSPYAHLVDVGNYYTIRPYGGMEKVLLFPKDWFKIEKDETEYFGEERVMSDTEYINDLLRQNKYEIINK